MGPSSSLQSTTDMPVSTGDDTHKRRGISHFLDCPVSDTENGYSYSDSSDWYSSDRSDSESTDNVDTHSEESWNDDSASDSADTDERECLKTGDWGWLGLPVTTSRARVDALLSHYGLGRSPYDSKAFAFGLRNHPDRDFAEYIPRAIDCGVD